MTPEMIRQLPDRYALIIRGGMSPVIARLPMAWKDPAYRNARRAHQAIAILTAAPEAAGPHPDVPRPRDPWPGRESWPGRELGSGGGLGAGGEFGPGTLPGGRVWDDLGPYPWQ
jgi:hypothetical protein